MPLLLHQNAYRLAATPAVNLPFGVRSVGHYKICPPFASRKKTVSFLQLFWCVRGSGIIDFNDRRRTLKQNQIALYYPNMRHYWHADRQYWEFYYLTMDGPFAASLLTAFGLEAGIHDAGPAPAALFRKLALLVKQPYQKAELHACLTAFTVLVRAAGLHTDRTNKEVKKAAKLMHQEYRRPTFNIKTLVAGLGVQRNAFCARFQTVTGIPPGVYLGRLRMQDALLLLKGSDLAITQVALRCGYTDVSYFSRAIRRITGYTPLQFRLYHRHRLLRSNA